MKKKKKTQEKQPLQRRAKETKKAILEASARILGQEGLHAFNTNRVAEKAGVSVGSLYQYFDNKDAIISDLTQEHLNKRNLGLLAVLAELEAQLLPLPLEAGIEKMLRAAFAPPGTEFKFDQEMIAQAFRLAAPERLKVQDQILIPAFKAYLEEKGFQAKKGQNIELALYVIIQSVRGLIAANAVSPLSSDASHTEDLIREASQMILKYLKPR